MVLAEVPLWVSHGSNNATDADANIRLPGLGGGAGGGTNKSNAAAAATSTTTNNNDNNNTHKSQQQQQLAHDAATAKAALSLLSSTKFSGGGSRRAPLYSIDVHPDGTRFATAAGDGSVKIWGVGSLFNGKLVLENGNGNSNGTNKKKKKDPSISRYTENGNYVSSNSEEYYEDDSSGSFSEGGHGTNSNNTTHENGGSQQSASAKHQQSQQQQNMPSSPQVGVNDLSGLVRKKKGGSVNVDAASASGSGANPFAAAASASTNTSNTNTAPRDDQGPLSPLSRLTQQPPQPPAPGASSSTGEQQNNNVNASNQSTTSANNNIPPVNTHTQQQKQQKLLSTITSHEGSVLSLRFSPSGRYLATAGDDSYVNIYVRSNKPSLAKGNLVGVNADGESSSSPTTEDVEHWDRIAICRGHALDVVGLAWAPDDSHLVSCSLDSVHPVIVWRLFDVLSMNDTSQDTIGGGGGSSMMGGMGGRGFGGGGGLSSSLSSSVHIHTLHPFKVLGRDVHTSTVKGVAFDPAGKYLATSGDDPAICLWRAFDDWGLEARIDSSSGVFRSKKRKVHRSASNIGDHGGGTNANNVMEEMEEDDPGELASLSLFRRISFAPDGSHVCGTNGTLRGKNIAAMISREGWAASGPRDGRKSSADHGEDGGRKAPPGAANLVGHKQPVVASRHCPVFFSVPKRKKRGSTSSSSESSSEESSSEDDDPDAEPEYATLVALGDKRGFVTVWSTKLARPLFKMQCSESKCTVTDISWGLVRRPSTEKDGGDGSKDSLIMVVSLLDGYVVALHFDIPTEVGGGSILSADKTRQIFRMKYGIDDFVGNYCFSPGKKRRSNKRLVDDAGPMLIENALQLAMEMEAEGQEGGDKSEEDSVEKPVDTESNQNQASQSSQPTMTGNIKDKQVESTKSGKKRIRPVLMSINNDGAAPNNNVSDEDNAQKEDGGEKKRQKKSKDDSLQGALDLASKAASVAEGVSTQASSRVAGGTAVQSTAGLNNVGQTAPAASMGSRHPATSLGPSVRIPYITNKIFSVDLASKAAADSFASADQTSNAKIVADCANSTATTSWPSTTLTISCGGVKQWKDIIVKAKCTALSANHQVLVVGTANGCFYLYGTSSTMGWGSGKAFRAFPPFVLGSPVVEISISSTPSFQDGESSSEIVVVTSDGSFYVYAIMPLGPKLKYKGSVVPAMQHMYLSSISSPNQQRAQPKMARIQLTDSKQLMLILVMPMKQSSSSGAGGRLLQGFIYNRDMELWMRVSDSSNFALSDFYSSIPCGTKKEEDGKFGILAKMDSLVRSSASMASAKQMYQKVASAESNNATTTHQIIVTRSHCEDRLACAIALDSAVEFQTWLKHYSRCLSSACDADGLRFLVDIFLGDNSSSADDNPTDGDNELEPNSPSFLSVGKQSLGLEGKDVVRKSILPEMSKNRMLQRLTNEISMELDCL